LKGVRKADHAGLVEIFNIHKESKRGGQGELVPMSPLLSPLMNTSGGGGGGDARGSIGGLGGIGGVSGLGISSAIGTPSLPNLPLPNMQTRFDPTGFGEKLFSVARDGVERIGSGNINTTNPINTGEVAGGSSVDRTANGSPQVIVDEKSLEGNLKSIGKFFRRDVSGGFGMGMGRFGGGKGSGDDGGK
jgi:hypothetical protein